MDVPQHGRYLPITLIKRKIFGTLCSLGFRQAGGPMGDTESEPDFLQNIKNSDIFAFPEEHVPMSHELFSAVSAEKEEWMEKVTSYDKPMACLKSYRGDSVLHVAAASGHLEMVKKIVSECPCLLLEPNSTDQLPLHVAARAGHLAVVEALVSTLTFVSATKPEEEREILNLYVVKDKNGNTPLHLALKGSHETIVNCLLEADKQALFLANKDGKSPLYLAVEAGFVSLVKAMLNKVKIFPNDGLEGRNSNLDSHLEGRKCLVHAALKAKNIEILDVILKEYPNEFPRDERDEEGMTCLSFGASKWFL